MKAVWHISWHEGKREAGKHGSFGLIIMITALILHTALLLVFHVEEAYDTTFKRLNSANINLVVSQLEEKETIHYNLTKQPGIQAVEIQEAIDLNTVIHDFKGTDFEITTIFASLHQPEMNQWEWIKEPTKTTSEGIYLPLYMAEFGGYDQGDTIAYQIDGAQYEFEVLGIFEEMQYGNFSSGRIGVMVPTATYDKLIQRFPAYRYDHIAIKTVSTSNTEKVLQECQAWMKEQGIDLIQGDNDSLHKGARMMTSNLLLTILFVFACVILLIGLWLSQFRIKHEIEVDQIRLGICKALGYTNYQMIQAKVLPNLFVTFGFVTLGVIGSYALLPMVTMMIELQAGFQVDIGFDGVVSVSTILLLSALVGLSTWYTARRLTRLQPIQAIQGFPNAKKKGTACFPLRSTRAGLFLPLMLKQMRKYLRQTLLYCGVIMLLTYLICFASILFYNSMVEPDHLMDALNEEVPSIIIQTTPSQTDSIKESLAQREEVASIISYQTMQASIENHIATMFVAESFDQLANDFCYAGRNPKTSSEIAIGSAIQEQAHYQINDTIEITMEGMTKEFVISGFLQSVNHQGNVMELTEEGWHHFSPTQELTTLYVYLEEEASVATALSEYKDAFQTDIVQIINMVELNETGQAMYTQILQLVIMILFLLSIGLVTLILYVIINSMVASVKEEFGILKAIGYTNRQLQLQLVGALFLPSIVAGLLSIGIASFTLPYICAMIWKTIGIYQNHFAYPMMMLLGSGILLWLISAGIMMGLTHPIKKISAYALIKGS